MRQAVILAGGKGSRLASRLDGAPKPLVKIDGIPLLERQLTLLAKHGVEHVLLMANHRVDALEAFCAGFRSPGMQIDIVQDSNGPRGTAGAVYDAAALLAPTFLVLYGDTLMDVDLSRMWQAHGRASAADGALGTLFLHPNDHPYDSDLVDMDRHGLVRAFHSKPHEPGSYHRNLVNAALYVLDRKIIERVPVGSDVVDFGKDFFPLALALGMPLRGYVTFEYIKDIGTPARLDRAEADLRSGKVARSALTHRQRAVFVDRDGTLNRPAGHITTPSAMELIDGVGAAVARLNRGEFRCVMVTNQPVLARGDCDEAGIDAIHAKLETQLGQQGGFLDAIYICPHHPDKGFSGEVAELKITCDCRKPAPGLLLKAEADLAIDLVHSWMVGDSAADIGAAHAAAVRSILVRTGGVVSTMLAQEPDYEVADFSAAVDFILFCHQVLTDLLRPIARTIHSGTLVRVAGQSQQGKSLVAGVLKELLQALGRPATHVRLDRWLVPQGQRLSEVTVKAKLDVDRLNAQLGDWFSGGSADVTLPSYDPQAACAKDGPRLTLSTDAIVIVDGALSFDVGCTNTRQSVNIFIDGPEQLRSVRVVKEYLRRGLAPDQAQELWRCELAEQFPIVEAQRQRADHVLTMPITTQQENT